MPGLDDILHGGFLPGGFYLLQGDPGSDLPIVLLANTEASPLLDSVMELFGNVTLLQRPLHPHAGSRSRSAHGAG